MKSLVHLLNVTTVSQLRIDGYPSVFGHGSHKDMDCSHWCPAGVPDTWNVLLYICSSHTKKNQQINYVESENPIKFKPSGLVQVITMEKRVKNRICQ